MALLVFNLTDKVTKYMSATIWNAPNERFVVFNEIGSGDKLNANKFGQNENTMHSR